MMGWRSSGGRGELGASVVAEVEGGEQDRPRDSAGRGGRVCQAGRGVFVGDHPLGYTRGFPHRGSKEHQEGAPRTRGDIREVVSDVVFTMMEK